MSRGLTDNRTGNAARALLLGTVALALTLPAFAVQAQQTQLRGTLAAPAAAPEDSRAAQAGPAEPYRPFADETTEESATTGSIFGALAGTQDDASARMPEISSVRDRQPPANTRQAPRRPPLPDEQETGTEPANRRAATVDALDKAMPNPAEERTGAIEGRDVQPQDDPYGAQGIRIGSFTLRPSMEQGITVTSNADSSFDGRSAVLSETTLRFSAASDWENHSATAWGYGIFRKTLSGQEVEDAQGRVEGTLDLDLDNDWRAVARLGYEAAPQTAASPVVIVGTASQPLRQTFDGSLGLLKDVGKLRFGLTGAVTHDSYGNADLSSGGTLSQKDRDSTLYTAILRGGYQISPALTPFAELEIGRRTYVHRIDANGYQRSGNRLGARAGLALDLGEKLGGEVSAGWIRESFEDDRLAPLSGATIAADLNWSPQRGTVIGLRGDTTLEGTTTAAESGSILYAARLTAERQVRANLTANAALGTGWRDYLGTGGHDLIYSAEAGMTWWMNRHAGITGRVRHETVTSNLPYRDSRANSAYLGLTLQR